MSLWEFVARLADNVAWIIGSLDDPAAIATAILNIIHLILENLGLFG